MANVNKVMLIGRLTRDPEAIPAGKGGAKFGFAVNNRKLNNDTQQWEDVPVFIDVEIWNRGENRQAERVVQTLRKGQQVFIEGHLKMDTWDDKNGGGKRSKLLVVVDNFQYLDARAEGSNGDQMMRAPRPVAAAPSRPAPAPTAYQGGGYDDDPGMSSPPRQGGGGGNEEDIPF